MQTRVDASEAAREMTKEQLAQYRILSDPVRWAEFTLRDPQKPSQPLRLRWYQKKILRSKSKKRVIRMGRRMGKSLALAVDILWYAFTHKMAQVLVVCPYKSQVEVVFTAINRLIGDSAVLKQSIDKNKTNPFFISLFNGSVIRGFTAGTRSGQKGAQIRGQASDRIYLDEVDYMGNEAIVAVTAILLDSPDTTLWGSSTPTGKREDFYKWCTLHEKLGFDHFHFKASQSPTWTKELEFFLRETTTEQQYLHEYDAEFGEEVVGVFQNIHLDACLRDYWYVSGSHYDEKGNSCNHDGIAGEYNPRNIYGLGVDWNSEGTGVQIIVMEYCIEAPEGNPKLLGKFRVFNRYEVSSSGFTQTKAVNLIIELNRIYNPAFIYVDEGYGAMQIEELMRAGLEHPGTGLAEKVRPINFSSKIKVVDPSTQRLVQKPMKAFMVNNAVNYVETHRLMLPSMEDEQVKLVGQMRGYTVERRSLSGAPVYSSGNDHILDALMLALLGFTMEFSNLGHIDRTNRVKISTTAIRQILGRSGTTDRWMDLGDKKYRELAPQRTEKLTEIAHEQGYPTSYTRDSKQGKYDLAGNGQPVSWGDPHRSWTTTRKGFHTVRRNLANTPTIPRRTGTGVGSGRRSF